MIQVSIIIVNYNSAYWALKCIESIFRWTKGLTYEIILVDNDSRDREIEQITKHFPDVVFLQMKTNIGFGQACNKAVSISKGHFIHFLNPDTQFQNNCILQYLEFWEANHKIYKIGCLGSLLQNEIGHEIHSFGVFPNLRKLLKNKVSSLINTAIGRKQKPIIERTDFINSYFRVDYITGANLFLEKNTFLNVEGFDNKFFMYFEETDLQFRLSWLGLYSYIIKGPRLLHYQGKSFIGQELLLNVFYLKSLLVYCKKHNPLVSFCFFKMTWFFLDLKSFLSMYFLKLKRVNL